MLGQHLTFVEDADRVAVGAVVTARRANFGGVE